MFLWTFRRKPSKQQETNIGEAPDGLTGRLPMTTSGGNQNGGNNLSEAAAFQPFPWWFEATGEASAATLPPASLLFDSHIFAFLDSFFTSAGCLYMRMGEGKLLNSRQLHTKRRKAH